VLATTSYLADMAQHVAGDRLKIESLIPVGVDPHGFQPAPGDLRRVADSTLLIINGAGFEEFLQELLDNAGGQRQVVEASAGLKGRAAREGEAAVMTEADLADALCVAAGEANVEEKTAGADVAGAVALREKQAQGEEHGGSELFTVTLAPQADGTFGGYLRLDAESTDYQVATANGVLSIVRQGTTEAIVPEMATPLNCDGLARGGVYPLDEGAYTFQLSGFRVSQAQLLFGEAGGHRHDAGDPHFWLDPVNAVRYVENIRDGLSAADPGGAATYKANADAYIVQLKELDRVIASEVAQVPAARRKLVTNHESFGYFADRYGFTIIGTIIPSVSTGASPSAQQLARLADRVKATGATAIFLETGANPQLAEQLAQEAGIAVVTGLYSHSLSESGGPAPSYIDMMRYNTRTIVNALTRT
jgi:ABC-type Zn uptake system ZnuABC Zn-binding protein ZnuA